MLVLCAKYIVQDNITNITVSWTATTRLYTIALEKECVVVVGRAYYISSRFSWALTHTRLVHFGNVRHPGTFVSISWSGPAAGS